MWFLTGGTTDPNVIAGDCDEEFPVLTVRVTFGDLEETDTVFDFRFWGAPADDPNLRELISI